MSSLIDQDFWRESLVKPNWYLILKDDFGRLEELAKKEKDYTKRKNIKRQAYEAIESAIAEKHINLATSGNDLDQERKPIDRIIIHHTKNLPGISLERLNAMHLLRIYGRYYASPTDERENYLKGTAVWSGHYYKDIQVFWGYHWLIRNNGTSEQILKDSYIGWHAGNWDINTRSVGICIDDDLSAKEAERGAMEALVKIINQNYLSVSERNIVGHCDVNKNTECPGSLFHQSWRKKTTKNAAPVVIL